MKEQMELLCTLELVRGLKATSLMLARHFDAAVMELEQHERELAAQVDPSVMNDKRYQAAQWALPVLN